MSDIQEKIQEELANARAVCSTEGADSQDCAAAYDALEELQAEAAHKRQTNPEKSYFEQYCDANPEAAECRVYED
jgi:tetrahydrodipicolinate N-succinyltransferase